MQRLIYITVIFFSVCFNLFGQTQTDREIDGIVKNLIPKLAADSTVKYVVVSDFTDGSIDVTPLGQYLAEEFTFKLSNARGSFSVLDRSKLKELIQEIQDKSDGIIDPLSAAKMGKLKGMDSLLYGTIIESTDYYNVYVKILRLETLQTLVSTRGKITKLPSLPRNYN